MESSYTEEELATLPQTENVFETPPVVFDEHKWIQMGYMLHDHCQPRTSACQEQGIPIPSGKVLVRRNRTYTLIDERS